MNCLVILAFSQVGQFYTPILDLSGENRKGYTGKPVQPLEPQTSSQTPIKST